MTAVEWLVNEILVEVDRYDDEGNKIGIDYWNAYTSCTSLLEYVNKAKKMEKQQKDDYAIEFAEWIDDIIVDRKILYDTSSIKELLEIFKNEKGWI